MIMVFACLAWLILLVFWGGFWRADQRLDQAPLPEHWPEVAVLIPARNEAETIGEVLHSHRSTRYPGKVMRIVTDDHSDDQTGAIARASGAEVVVADPLPPGWSGKLWALDNALRHADRIAPDADFVLLTDADIVHDSGTLQGLVAKAMSQNLDAVSLMARLDARGFWGSLLIPAFIFFFQKLYPFRWVNGTRIPIAAAAGGCVLVKRDALRRIGDFPAIREALIDDCTLAARIKQTGGAIWLGLADREVISLRDNRSFQSVWAMVRRTAFTQLRHSWALLAVSVLGMSLLYLAPVLGLIFGLVQLDAFTGAAGAVAWLFMAIAYWPTLRLYGKPRWQAMTLPVAASLYMAMTIASALAHLRGSGGAWKGRTYS